MELYVKSNCGFSRRTLMARENLHAQDKITVRNISDDVGAKVTLRKVRMYDFVDRLDDELGRAWRHRRQLSILLCGIDDLDVTIETRGRRIADKMLQAVAEVIDTALRTGDVVSRVSGEGLAMLLPETDAVGATLVADRIRQQVAGLVIPDVGRVTVSVGLAAAPEHAVDRDALLDAAERALYLAKREGRNSTRSAGDGAGVVMAFDRPLRRGSGDRVVDLLVRVLRLRDPALADHIGGLIRLHGGDEGRSRGGRQLLEDVPHGDCPPSLASSPGQYRTGARAGQASDGDAGGVCRSGGHLLY
jgi:diguanylate cyclase (GGDEF)-like protein